MKQQSAIPNLDIIVEKIKSLYVNIQFKYLIQFPNGSYFTANSHEKNDKPLSDSMIMKHLQGEMTIGVFSEEGASKFLTFDVDCNDEPTKARKVTLDVIKVLIEYGIKKEDIHASLSGRKGYHIDLFFDQPIPLPHLLAFYNAVVNKVGETTKTIEFRPNYGQGVKLPLGVHQVTKKRCWFVNRDTLEPIEDFNYLLSVQPMDASLILQMEFDLSGTRNEKKYIPQSVSITINSMKWDEVDKIATTVMKTGRLVESGTRHNVTYALASKLNAKGWKQEEVIEYIMNILHNTPREYFNSEPDFWEQETRRIVSLVFKKNYYLVSNKPQKVPIYKSEMIEVLKCGTFMTKKTLYHMIITSKQHGSIFNFPESIALKRLGTKTTNTFWNAIKRLVDGGFIEVIERGEIDDELSQIKGHAYNKPNKYRLLIPPPSEDEPFVVVNITSDMVDVAWLLLTEDEIKNYVKRREYENRWMPKKPSQYIA